MQSRLAQLKEIIVDFNFKPSQNDLPSGNQQGFRPYKGESKQQETSNGDEDVEDDEETNVDDVDEMRNYETTQKYFNSLKQKPSPVKQQTSVSDMSSKPRLSSYVEEDSEDEKELNAANREQLKEHKT